MNIYPVKFQRHAMPAPVADGHGRKIGYLRISVVDRCNLRCDYCRPSGDDYHAAPRQHLLSFEEIERAVRIAASLGVEKIRLTGGEPLVRKGIVDLVARIAAVPGIRDLAMSTNAVLLDEYALPLRAAGLQRVNISLDTLDAQKFSRLTGGNLHDVLRGIHAAQDAGLAPIRLNAVLLRGINDGEAAQLIDFSARERLELRFIELMPMREGLDWQQHYFPMAELLAQPEIIARVDVSAWQRQGSSAARYLPLRDGQGRVGFIEPMSNRFCEGCDRLRLMSDGKLRPCLPADNEVDLRSAMRSGSSDSEIAGLLRNAAASKQEIGTYRFEARGHQRSMIAIGG
ncbi:MAG: GTP 3',8-cyclase MoaA [Nitrosomonadales bacterium]|nr:GTP 3',8-cyclase MoaA [Nitrosomonadales bacterium]